MSILHQPTQACRPGRAGFAGSGVLAIPGFMFVQKSAHETKGRQVEEILRKSYEWADIL